MVNFNQLMKQAQTLQTKMQEEQQKRMNAEYIGKSGGGLVSVTISGQYEIKKLEIDPSLIKSDEKEILEDLVIAAYNDAKQKADAASADVMSNMMGGMSLPPGFKMPF